MRESWQSTNPAPTQAQKQSYELADPNIHRTYEMLEHVKGMNLQIQNSRIVMAQDNRLYQRPRADKWLVAMNPCK